MLDKKIIFLLLIISAGALLSSLGVWDSINEQWIDKHIRDQGIQGFLVFIGICTLFTGCGFPRQIVAFLGGYAFGFLTGFFLATIATTLGCIVSYYTAKIFARPILRKKYPQKIKSLQKFLYHRTFTKTIIIRLLPVGSNLITNLIAGVARINIKSFFIGSFIGYFPQMIIFSLAGSGIELMSYWKLTLSVLLFIISSLLSGYLYKEYKINRDKDDSVSV